VGGVIDESEGDLPVSAGSAAGPLMPAVLLGGRENALSVARALWRDGIAVDLLSDSQADAPPRHSRAVRRYVAVSVPDAYAAEWMEWLTNDSAPAVLLACSDEGVEFIAGHRAALEALGHRPVEANDEAQLWMLDKTRTSEIARAAGVPSPQTMTVANLAELDRCQFTFPCGVKPVSSHHFVRRFPTQAKGTVLTDLEHARRVLGPLMAAGLEMLLTEVIDGDNPEYRHYHTYLDEHGEPLFNATTVKLRQFPTDFGLGTYHVTEWDAEVAQLGLRFAQAAKLRGLVHVEFKRDARDHQLKLIECNPRFAAPNELIRAAGIDLALLAYNRVTGRPIPRLDGFRERLGMWLIFNDLRALRAYRRNGEMTVRAWLRSMLRRQVPAVFARDDPNPSWWAWRWRALIIVRDRTPSTPSRRRQRAGAAVNADPYSPST